MTRKLMIYSIILVSLFFLLLTLSVIPHVSRMPQLVEVTMVYRPTTMLSLAGSLALAGMLAGLKALLRYGTESKKDLFP
jgi:hypothetical protein